MSAYFKDLVAPTTGEIITMEKGILKVPDHPIIPFIEGDGTGPDIWRASKLVFDCAMNKAYSGKRAITWLEVYAGEKAFANSTTGFPMIHSQHLSTIV